MEGILVVFCLSRELDNNLILFDHFEVSKDWTLVLLYPQGFALIYFLLISHTTGKSSDSTQHCKSQDCKDTYKAR